MVIDALRDCLIASKKSSDYIWILEQLDADMDAVKKSMNSVVMDARYFINNMRVNSYVGIKTINANKVIQIAWHFKPISKLVVAPIPKLSDEDKFSLFDSIPSSNDIFWSSLRYHELQRNTLNNQAKAILYITSLCKSQHKYRNWKII